MDDHDPTDEELIAQAEEYYSDPDNLLEAFEMEFLKHKGSSFEPVYAVELIQACIKVNRPIPTKLHPYVDQACNIWKSSKGAKQIVSSAKTDKKWEFLIQQVDLLHNWVGMTKADAYEQVNPENPETLKKMYIARKKRR